MGLDPADVHPNLANTRLQGSDAHTRLYTAIAQHLGISCQVAYRAHTCGELCTAIRMSQVRGVS
jgi:hypothetical protein